LLLGRRRQKLASASLIPLPKSELELQVFPLSARVLAIYPKTTSFYPGHIVKESTQRMVSGSGAPPFYLHHSLRLLCCIQTLGSRISIQFDDDEDESGTIPEHKIQRQHIIAYPT
jgi:hypothetical protein